MTMIITKSNKDELVNRSKSGDHLYWNACSEFKSPSELNNRNVYAFPYHLTVADEDGTIRSTNLNDWEKYFTDNPRYFQFSATPFLTKTVAGGKCIEISKKVSVSTFIKKLAPIVTDLLAEISVINNVNIPRYNLRNANHYLFSLTNYAISPFVNIIVDMIICNTTQIKHQAWLRSNCNTMYAETALSTFISIIKLNLYFEQIALDSIDLLVPNAKSLLNKDGYFSISDEVISTFNLDNIYAHGANKSTPETVIAKHILLWFNSCKQYVRELEKMFLIDFPLPKILENVRVDAPSFAQSDLKTILIQTFYPRKYLLALPEDVDTVLNQKVDMKFKNVYCGYSNYDVNVIPEFNDKYLYTILNRCRYGKDDYSLCRDVVQGITSYTSTNGVRNFVNSGYSASDGVDYMASIYDYHPLTQSQVGYLHYLALLVILIMDHSNPWTYNMRYRDAVKFFINVKDFKTDESAKNSNCWSVRSRIRV